MRRGEYVSTKKNIKIRTTIKKVIILATFHRLYFQINGIKKAKYNPSINKTADG